MKIIINHAEKIEIIKPKKPINFIKISLCLFLFVVYMVGCCLLLNKLCSFAFACLSF